MLAMYLELILMQSFEKLCCFPLTGFETQTCTIICELICNIISSATLCM